MSYLDNKNFTAEQRATYQTLSILENSAHHQNRLQAEQLAFAGQERKNAELHVESEKHRLAREAELKAEADARRKEAAANFEQNLREQFFAKNPHVSESDYLSVKDDLKRQALLSNMDFGNKAEEITKSQVNYGAM
jgi:hypothetical protein